MEYRCCIFQDSNAGNKVTDVGAGGNKSPARTSWDIGGRPLPSGLPHNIKLEPGLFSSRSFQFSDCAVTGCRSTSPLQSHHPAPQGGGGGGGPDAKSAFTPPIITVPPGSSRDGGPRGDYPSPKTGQSYGSPRNTEKEVVGDGVNFPANYSTTPGGYGTGKCERNSCSYGGPGGPERDTRCSPGGQRRVFVPAGKFDFRKCTFSIYF